MGLVLVAMDDEIGGVVGLFPLPLWNCLSVISQRKYGTAQFRPGFDRHSPWLHHIPTLPLEKAPYYPPFHLLWTNDFVEATPFFFFKKKKKSIDLSSGWRSAVEWRSVAWLLASRALRVSLLLWFRRAAGFRCVRIHDCRTRILVGFWLPGLGSLVSPLA
jgi:hypothetical protein